MTVVMCSQNAALLVPHPHRGAYTSSEIVQQMSACRSCRRFVVAPGRVYRPDTVDATHMFMFHQLEALVVDEDVTMVDLKTSVNQLIHTYFGSLLIFLISLSILRISCKSNFLSTKTFTF